MNTNIELLIKVCDWNKPNAEIDLSEAIKEFKSACFSSNLGSIWKFFRGAVINYCSLCRKTNLKLNSFFDLYLRINIKGKKNRESFNFIPLEGKAKLRLNEIKFKQRRSVDIEAIIEENTNALNNAFSAQIDTVVEDEYLEDSELAQMPFELEQSKIEEQPFDQEMMEEQPEEPIEIRVKVRRIRNRKIDLPKPEIEVDLRVIFKESNKSLKRELKNKKIAAIFDQMAPLRCRGLASLFNTSFSSLNIVQELREEEVDLIEEEPLEFIMPAETVLVSLENKSNLNFLFEHPINKPRSEFIVENFMNVLSKAHQKEFELDQESPFSTIFIN